MTMPITNNHSPLSPLNESEQVGACCIIAREKLEIGDYAAGVAALEPWWTLGQWPSHADLLDNAAAELLLTAGTLSAWMATTKQVSGGQKPAEAMLSGAITLFERIGMKSRASEARIELACCYFWQGQFDLAKLTLHSSLEGITDRETELRCVAVIRLALVEHHAGRLHEALKLLNEALPLIESQRLWIKGRFHLELATTLKDLGVAEGHTKHSTRSLTHYQTALVAFEKLGNLRYIAIAENNLGYLLLTLQSFDDAQVHLFRARSLFEEFGDQVRRAQVDETIAQLRIGCQQYSLAKTAIELAVYTLEGSGEDVLLAEALTTQGLVLCRLGHRQDAKPILERTRRVAERCGDREGAGRALLILIEEMCE
ncbi:MAG TPA: tetratricopeptide repeat protein, partial [Anaerolineales bacterium]|nr:tetratricopeptide repeat protein [Anaerolineales bacterium]